MKPGYELDIPSLQRAIAPWLPGNPDSNPLVRPNQETMQVYLQLKHHGFKCDIESLCVRPVINIGKEGSFVLLVALRYDDLQFDGRDIEPHALAEQYCDKHGYGWVMGDPVDQQIGVKIIEANLLSADKTPNLGLYRAIEGALSQMQRDRIDADTQEAHHSGKTGGRL